jgi:predicted 3-demethylubiquinone-9 3-methyltransferase (glyoxalase superfamily)
VAEFYVSLFPGSKIINVTRLTDTFGRLRCCVL